MNVQITPPYGGMKACRWLPAMVSVLMRMPATGGWVGGWVTAPETEGGTAYSKFGR